MASKGQSLTVHYEAIDTATGLGKTGDAANHTLRVIKDNSAAAAPSGTIAEVDATNAPGIYKITITSAENTADFATLCGKSSTSGIKIMKVSWANENLPTAAPNASNGLPTIGSGSGQILITSGGYVNVNMAQAVPVSNTPESVGDCWIQARAMAAGNIVTDGNALTMTVYAANGTTPIKIFTVNDALSPTSRSS